MKDTITLEELTTPKNLIPIRFGLKELLKSPSEGGIGPANPGPAAIEFKEDLTGKTVEDFLMGGRKRI